MFGFIYGLFTLFGSGYESVRRSVATKQNRDYCEKLYYQGKNPNRVYYDWQGHERDLTTGKKVITYYERGHYYKAEVKGRVLEDITETRKRKETIEKLRFSDEETVVYMGLNEIRNQWRAKYGNKMPIENPPILINIYKITKQFCYEDCVDFTKVFLNNKKEGPASSCFVKFIDGVVNGKCRCWSELHTGKIIALKKDNKPGGKFQMLMKPSHEEWTKGPQPVKEEVIEELIDRYNELVDQGFIVSQYYGNQYLKLFPDKFEC